MRSYSSSALLAGAMVGALGCSTDDVVDAPVIAPDRLEFRTAPAQAIAGVPFDPAVQVLILLPDGRIDVTSTAAVSLTALSATVADTLRGATSVTATAGIATFPAVSFSRVSAATRLVARSSGLTGAESTPIRVGHGVAAQLVFLTQPDSAVAGRPLPALRVQVRDVGGNRVLSASGPVTVAIATGPTGASVTGTATADLSSGEASFNDVRLPRAGTGYTLTASLVGEAGIRSPVTRVFATAPAAPASLAFLSEPTASTVGFPVTPAIRVAIVDEFANIVGSASTPVTLDLAVAAAGTQLTGTTTAAPMAGIATFTNVRVDRAAATVRLRAAAAGLTSAVSAGFAVGAP